MYTNFPYKIQQLTFNKKNNVSVPPIIGLANHAMPPGDQRGVRVAVGLAVQVRVPGRHLREGEGPAHHLPARHPLRRAQRTDHGSLIILSQQAVWDYFSRIHP